MHKYAENVKSNVGTMSLTTSTSSTTSTSTSVDMKYYNNFCGMIGMVTASAAADATCYIRESTDGTTWSATYLATGTLASATTPAIGWFGTIECRAEQLSDGYRYLRVEATPGTAAIVNIALLRFNSRYPAATLPTP